MVKTFLKAYAKMACYLMTDFYRHESAMQFFLDFDNQPKKSDIDLIQQGLDDFNKIILKQQPQEFAIYLRDSKNAINGGIFALSYSDSLHIILLWVNNSARSKGYGSALLKAAEEEGIKRKCRYVFVDTFEFQGEGFYLKNGYQCVGRIDNVLLTHAKVFFKKSLIKIDPLFPYAIELISPGLAEKICRDITADLPEYFGIPEANERYAKGVLKRTSFATSHLNEYVGLITLEFPFPNNANIYWMATKNAFQGKGIGSYLLKHAENYCLQKGSLSLTVETLSPKQKDENYLKSYQFYQKMGFKPLFELNTYGPDFLMIYLQKFLT